MLRIKTKRALLVSAVIQALGVPGGGSRLVCAHAWLHSKFEANLLKKEGKVETIVRRNNELKSLVILKSRISQLWVAYA